MYQTYDELQHYGVLGMKWGRRKSDSLKTKIEDNKIKIDDIRTKKGVTSKRFLKKASENYNLKQKKKIVDSKLKNDPSSEIAAKYNLRVGKKVKKNLSNITDLNGSELRNIFGRDLSSKDMTAIRLKGAEIYRKQATREYYTNKAAPYASALASVIIGAVAQRQIKI